LYAGVISDVICFIITIFIFNSEYSKLKTQESIISKNQEESEQTKNEHQQQSKKFTKVITISREYGSGGRYIAKLLAEKLNIPCYDKELIRLTAEESGFSTDFISKNEEQRNDYYLNDNQIFVAETKAIKKLAKSPCIIVGRCAGYILKDNENVIKIFLYSDEQSKEKRAINFYNLSKDNAKKEIENINKKRSKHYKFYTNRDWKDINNYDLIINVDKYGVIKTVENLNEFLAEKN